MKRLSAPIVVVIVVACAILLRFWTREEHVETRGMSKTDLRRLCLALNTFEMDNGRYPTNAEGLEALVVAPPGMPNWQGPYIERGFVPPDPWGMPYVYVCPGVHIPEAFDLSSNGPDGTPGTADDLTSWD